MMGREFSYDVAFPVSYPDIKDSFGVLENGNVVLDPQTILVEKGNGERAGELLHEKTVVLLDLVACFKKDRLLQKDVSQKQDGTDHEKGEPEDLEKKRNSHHVGVGESDMIMRREGRFREWNFFPKSH